jgi:hypothetical protein
MASLRSVVSAALAMLGSLGAGGEVEAASELRPVARGRITRLGLAHEHADLLGCDESRVEIEGWKTAPSGADLDLVCGACERVRQSDGSWAPAVGDVETLRRAASYGLCPSCARERFPDLLGDT